MRLYFNLLIILLLFSFTSFSQKTVEPENQPCDADFARLLVSQQVEEGKSVEETVKRIKILLRSADFLWKSDEPTARQYYSDAFEFAQKRFAENGFEKKRADKDSMPISLPDYRMEVVREISKKDSAWAKRLSEKILKEYDDAAKDRADSFDKNREISDLIGIANQSVKTNPELSLYFYRRVMQYPLDSHWLFAFYSAAKENQALADQVYSEALRAYANETPRRMLFLSAYPFGHERIFGVDKYQFGTSVPPNFSTNQNLQNQFFNTFFNRIDVLVNNPAVLYNSENKYRLNEIGYIVSSLRDLEPLISQNFPNLLPRFNSVKARANAMLNAENRKSLENREKLYEKSGQGFEEKLKDLEEADSDGKLTDYMIVSLVFAAKSDDHFEQIETWLDKIQDEGVRNSTKNYFYFKRSELATTENRFIDAEKYADKVEEVQHRAVLLFKLAEQQLKAKYQGNEAESVLLNVSKLARKSENSVEKAQVLLGLAYLFEKVNHSYALDELGEAINVINKLENPDIFSTSVFRQIIGKEFRYYAVFTIPGFNMETTFEEISKNDFQLSLAQAKSFNDKYFRTLAVLAVAKNCIKNASPKKNVKNKK